MKVENLMTREPATCSSTDSLTVATMKMWTDDCGILPVVDDGKLVGVVTDRDIAMALGMQGVPASRATVGDVINGKVFSCSPTDEVAAALELMAHKQVRRLPVVKKGRLLGLISLNDIVLEARATAGKEKKPTYGMVVKAMQGICEHRQMPMVAAAG